MRIEDLVKGNYYTFIRNGNHSDNFKNNYFIGKYKGNSLFGEYFYEGNKYYSSGSWNFSGREAIEEIRPATPQEIAHLNSCIKAGKYVEYKEENVLQMIEIY